MRRSIFKAGAVTVFGLLIAFAIVSANSSTRHAATTVAKAENAVAPAPASTDECTSSDVCCARETKAVVADGPRKAVKQAVARKAEATAPVGAAGMVIAIDESGQLTMPSAEQLQALRPQVMMPADPGVDVRFPNGVIGNSGTTTVDFTTLHIDASGKKVIGHMDVNAPQPAKPALEEK